MSDDLELFWVNTTSSAKVAKSESTTEFRWTVIQHIVWCSACLLTTTNWQEIVFAEAKENTYEGLLKSKPVGN